MELNVKKQKKVTLYINIVDKFVLVLLLFKFYSIIMLSKENVSISLNNSRNNGITIYIYISQIIYVDANLHMEMNIIHVMSLKISVLAKTEKVFIFKFTK